MDESTRFPKDTRQTTPPTGTKNRADITSPPSVRRTGAAVEESVSAAAAGAQGGVKSATQPGPEKENGKDHGIIDRVRDRAGAQLSNQKDLATDGLSVIARAVRTTTQELRDHKHETMAEYVERAADQLDRMSSGLKSKDIGELFRDAQTFARRQPAVFVGSAFAIGLLGARFFKSSPNRTRRGVRETWKQGDPTATGPAHMGYGYSQASARGEAPLHGNATGMGNTPGGSDLTSSSRNRTAGEL